MILCSHVSQFLFFLLFLRKVDSSPKVGNYFDDFYAGGRNVETHFSTETETTEDEVFKFSFPEKYAPTIELSVAFFILLFFKVGWLRVKCFLWAFS